MSDFNPLKMKLMTGLYSKYQVIIHQILQTFDEKIQQRLITMSTMVTTVISTLIENQRTLLSADHSKLKSELIQVINITNLNKGILKNLSEPQREIVYAILAFIAMLLAVILGGLCLVKSRIVYFIKKGDLQGP